MFMVPLLTVLVESLRRTFDADYPAEQFRGLWVSLEYPVAKANYPGIWVDFQPTTDVQAAGIGHVEHTQPASDGSVRAFTRWRYAGMVQLTCAAMSSLERATLIDEVIKVVAFGLENPGRAEFIRHLAANDLVVVDLQRDKLDLTTKGEAQGTPWGTDEVIYEQTVTIDCQGEFVSDGDAAALIPLSEVALYPSGPGETPPGGDGWQ
jgi:hypothetical protein